MARIAHQRHARRTDRGPKFLIALVVLTVVLVGCSSGSAQDAAINQARDAGLPDKLAARQATRTVERYFPPTGTPSPTEPVPPAVADLAITFGFRSDGTPDGSYASVPAGAGTAYAAVHLTGMSAGQVVRAIVTDAWGNQVATPEETIGPGAADRWLALPISLPADLAPGQYGVFIFADEHALGSLAFGVTSPGSSAQLLPPLPENPQIRSTVPPPGASSAPVTVTPTAPAP